MNYEEAIKELNTIYLATEVQRVPVVKEEVQEALKIGVDCIEKQIPIKAEYHAPDFDVRMFSWWTCGNCDCEIDSVVDKYCSYCGRPIDWSE